jgi:hypothetical protein
MTKCVKKLLTTIFSICLLFQFSAYGVTRTWTNANGNGNWNTAGNWSPSGTPASGDDVIFNSTSTANCSVNGNRTVTDITIASGYSGTITLNGNLTITDDVEINAGTLNVGSNSFTVSGDYQQNGGTFNGASGTLIFEGNFTQNNGTFTASSTSNEFLKDIVLNNGTFLHNNGNSVIRGSGSRNMNVNTTGKKIVYFNLTVDLGNNETLNSSDTLCVLNSLTLTNGKIDNARIEARGNVSVSSTYDGGNSVLIFSGSNNQNFSDAAATRNSYKGNIVLSKSGNAVVNLTSAIRLNGSGQNINFTSGLVVSSSTNLLEIGDNVTVTGGNNSSFVSGPVRKTGNDAFTFPVGKSGRYAPISISAPSNTTHHFTAEYFAASPNSLFSVNSKVATIATVSTAEYWILDRTNGTSNVNVTLSWNSSRSGGISNTSDLRVVRWDGSQWQNHGTSSVTGTTAAGTLTTGAAVTSFSPFTLGSINGGSQLPVELIRFTAEKNGGNISLNWATSSEINNAGFEVQRSADGVEFSAIGYVKGNGTTQNLNSYSFIDETPLNGVNYYRLKQIDFNGTFEYSPVVAEQHTPALIISAYPNPAREYFMVESSMPIEKITIMNAMGVVISVPTETSYDRTIIRTSDLRPDTYFVQVTQGSQVQIIRFIVAH